MRFSRATKPLLTAVISVLFSACVFETKTDHLPTPPKSLAYSVKLSQDPGGLRCSVFVQILRWPADEPVVFQLPPYYPDNPAMPVPGVTRGQIHAQDGSGHALAASDVVPFFSQGGGKWIALPFETRTLNYAVDLDPRNPARIGPPIPGLQSGVQMLDGSQLFILPAMGKSMSSHWRNPVFLTLNWQMGNGSPLMGDYNSVLHSNYQLMFFRGAANPARTFEFLAGTHRVTLYSNDWDDTLNLEALATRLQRWIPLLEKHFQTLPQERLWIGTNTIHAGIEGIGGYWFRQEYSGNAEVHLHELTHAFVGVMQGDFDDPWWKEGVTNYLGKVMAAEDGFYSDTSSEVAAYLMEPRAQIPSVMQYALSDPALRDRFYHPLDSDYVERAPEDFYSLLYGKGAQAAMLIDAWLLQNSDGKRDLFDAVRGLYQTGRPGFTRMQLAAELENLSGQRADTLLQSLCDTPGAFPTARLQQAFTVLQTFNRFRPHGSTVVAAKRNAGPAKKVEWKEFHSFGKF